jgi:hypothetical protein
VLTGGGSQLKHLKHLVELMTGMSTRIGYPNEHLAKSNVEAVTSPLYATGVGLVMKGFDYLDRRRPKHDRGGRERARQSHRERPLQGHLERLPSNIITSASEQCSRTTRTDPRPFPHLPIPPNDMKFDLPKELASIIKVIGVGGGGSNAVNHMYAQGIKGVDFIICNTDRQALDISPVPVKLQLGIGLTEGLVQVHPGARQPSGTGEHRRDPAIAEHAHQDGVHHRRHGWWYRNGCRTRDRADRREMGILTVGIVTSPFQWEGRKRKQPSRSGIEEMRNAVDTCW